MRSTNHGCGVGHPFASVDPNCAGSEAHRLIGGVTTSTELPAQNPFYTENLPDPSDLEEISRCRVGSLRSPSFPVLKSNDFLEFATSQFGATLAKERLGAA
jgi:hypothetical protein